HIDRGEHHGQERQRVGDARMPAAGQQGADERNAADGVGAAHQRSVQRGRQLRDDLEAHEDGKDKDRESGDEACRGVSSRYSLLGEDTDEWSEVCGGSSLARVISSSVPTVSFPSYTRCRSSVGIFLDYFSLAWWGTVDGRLSVPRIVTPLSVRVVCPGCVS